MICNIINVCAFLGLQTLKIGLILVLEGIILPLYLVKNTSFWGQLLHSHNSLFIFLNRKPIQIFLIPKLISLSRFLIILNKQRIVLMQSSHFNKILVKNE